MLLLLNVSILMNLVAPAAPTPPRELNEFFCGVNKAAQRLKFEVVLGHIHQRTSPWRISYQDALARNPETNLDETDQRLVLARNLFREIENSEKLTQEYRIRIRPTRVDSRGGGAMYVVTAEWRPLRRKWSDYLTDEEREYIKTLRPDQRKSSDGVWSKPDHSRVEAEKERLQRKAESRKEAVERVTLVFNIPTDQADLIELQRARMLTLTGVVRDYTISGYTHVYDPPYSPRVAHDEQQVQRLRERYEKGSPIKATYPKVCRIELEVTEVRLH